MKKLEQIERLVEEALDNKGYTMSVGRLKEKQLLMNLAKKCAEIDPYDFNAIGNRTDKYNDRLREGQVNIESKQEEKPALQPLPEKMPEWFANYFNGRGNDAISCYIHCKNIFGTQPREWWMDLKKGDKILYRYTATGYSIIFEWHGIAEMRGDGEWYLWDDKSTLHNVKYCYPYTGSPLDQLLSTFTDEQKALWDAIKEAKDE